MVQQSKLEVQKGGRLTMMRPHAMSGDVVSRMENAGEFRIEYNGTSAATIGVGVNNTGLTNVTTGIAKFTAPIESSGQVVVGSRGTMYVSGGRFVKGKDDLGMKNEGTLEFS